MSRLAEGAIAGPLPQWDRLLEQPRLGVVMCQNLRPYRHRLGKFGFQHAADFGVQRGAPAEQHRVVGDVPHQRVLEGIAGVGRLTVAQQEAGLGELDETLLQAPAAETRTRRKHPVRKFSSESGRGLRDDLDGSQPVQAGHQCVVQGGGHRKLKFAA